MLINRDFGIVRYLEGQPVAILWFEIGGTKIVRLYRILNPEKLKGVPALGASTKDDLSAHPADISVS